MKFVQYFASFAIVALVLSLSAFAKDSHSGKFTLSDTVQVGSTQLAPGDYKAEWNGLADNVKIDIIQNGKTVATTEGKIQTLAQRSPYDAVSTKDLPNNNEIYNCFFKFSDGPPATSHELNGWGDNLVHKNLQAVMQGDRIAVLYSSKDYSSEWNYSPDSKRFSTVDNTRFGVNIIVYALTR